jgi:hypothetical protein
MMEHLTSCEHRFSHCCTSSTTPRHFHFGSVEEHCIPHPSTAFSPLKYNHEPEEKGIDKNKPKNKIIRNTGSTGVTKISFSRKLDRL